MILDKGAGLLLTGLNALQRDLNHERSRIVSMGKKVARYPLKVIAAFVAAPILLVQIALKVEDRKRRYAAVIGCVVAILCAYIAGTFLGTMAGASMIWGTFGLLTALAFFVGTTMSIYLSVLFSILVLNSVCFLFLKINTQEMVEYLESISR